MRKVAYPDEKPWHAKAALHTGTHMLCAGSAANITEQSISRLRIYSLNIPSFTERILNVNESNNTVGSD